MSFSTTDLVAREVDKIVKVNHSSNKIRYDLTLHTPVKDLVITMLESIETVEDYNNNVGEYKLVNFIVGSGEYNFGIREYSHNLEITVKKYLRDDLLYTDTYKAVVVSLDTNLSDVKGNFEEHRLNQTSMTRVTLQLIVKELEVIRSLKVDGVYKLTTLNSLLISLMNKGMNSVKINDETIKLGLNIIPPDNDNIYDHLIIPTGIRLLDLPTYLQDTSYGVYNGDIGIYFRKYFKLDVLELNMFIYPLYTTPEEPKKELFIYHTNNPYLDHIDNTYKVVGDIIKIISTSELNVLEKGENDDMDTGNSITGSDPYSITDYNSVVTNGAIMFDKDTQVSGQKSYDREDGIHIEEYVGNESNLYKHRSKVNDKSLGTFQVTWNHGDTDILIPGMTTTLFYQKEKEVMMLKGVLQHTFTFYNESTKTTSTLLTIKMKRFTNAEE